MTTHKVYPSWRFHPSGDSKIVETAEADGELDKEWRDAPYPQEDIDAWVADHPAVESTDEESTDEDGSKKKSHKKTKA
jgi:hypothetical protein